MGCALAWPPKVAWEDRVLAWTLELQKMHENGVCLCIVFGGCRGHRTVFSEVKKPGVMWSGSASGRLLGSINRKNKPPENKAMIDPKEHWTLGMAWGDLFEWQPGARAEVEAWASTSGPGLVLLPRASVQRGLDGWGGGRHRELFLFYSGDDMPAE